MTAAPVPMSVSARSIPLQGADGPDFGTAMQAIVTWGTSSAFRERLLRESSFPIPGDLPAFLLVNQLVYRGAARPTDLADAIQTGRSNVSKIVRRLEAAGLVERAPDPRDERGVIVLLTEEGRKAGTRIVDTALASFGGALDGWTEDEFRQLERLLVKLARSLDALPGHPLKTIAGVSFSGS
ncbi:MAG: MarR family transcriptional regulator [Protaetiibacter sp.]